MVTISLELKEAIRAAGFTCSSIAPLVGITGATFSHKKKGRIDWRLNECYGILDILNIPRDQITRYFVGGKLKKKARKFK
jgi:hypothetical protein